MVVSSPQLEVGNGHLGMAGLTGLVEMTIGTPEVIVGLIDGPVLLDHPDLSGAAVRVLPGSRRAAHAAEYGHGTFIAGMLFGRRGAAAPGICPGCSLVLRAIFPGDGREAFTKGDGGPSASATELAAAVAECVDAGAWLINVSASFGQVSMLEQHELTSALDHAASRGVLVVAAAGNQGAIAGSALTRHPWVIPVVACDHDGLPLPHATLGSGIGRRGLTAPGSGVTSLAPDGEPATASGSSVATPFVTGALALLLSLLPGAGPTLVRAALCGTARPRKTIIPPLLDAWAAYASLAPETPFKGRSAKEPS
ncbi:MAG: S8 family serine peptidase [Trebonia sp.]|jgi:subtilisin family serine protease